MELNETGTVEIEKGKKKQVRCHKFKCNPIGRELMVHEDIDNKNHISISDCKTGYRLFGMTQKISNVKSSEIIENLKRFINHYTKEGIAEEFKRVEKIQAKKES